MFQIPVLVKGGEGSGHHLHLGRPGQQGGSLPGQGAGPPKVTIGSQEKMNSAWAWALDKWGPPLSMEGASFTGTGKRHDCDKNARRVYRADREAKPWRGGVIFFPGSDDYRTDWTAMNGSHIFNMKDGKIIDSTPMFWKEGTQVYYFGVEIQGVKPSSSAVSYFAMGEASLAAQREAAKGGEGSGHHGHRGRPGEQGGSLPGAGGFPGRFGERDWDVPDPNSLSGTWEGNYARTYLPKEYRDAVSTAWNKSKDVMTVVQRGYLIGRLLYDRDALGEDSGEPAILAYREDNPGDYFTSDYDARALGWLVKGSSVKGGEGSGHHGHRGIPGHRGGSLPEEGAGQATGFKKPPGERVWQHSQHEGQKGLTKLQTGELGEQVAMKALEQKIGASFSTLNVGVNNSPIDIGGDHTAVEVKAGHATNGRTAQHWRATIGQPGKAEQALIAKMSKAEKREHHDRKRDLILKRKNDFLVQMSKEAGAPVKGATVGVIFNASGTKADVFFIPGFHQRLPWNKYATDEYYLGTFEVEVKMGYRIPIIFSSNGSD